MAAGIEWFPLETNILTDDDKIFDLMDGMDPDEGFALLGRYVALLCRIYREGPALVVGERMARRIAHDLQLTLSGFAAFVNRCVDAGLLSRALWESERVLTSKGIQERWVKAKARAKSQGLPADMRQWSLLDEHSDDGLWNPSEAVESAPSASTPDEPQCSAFKKLTESENVPLDKIRLDKIRQEEIRQEDQSVYLSGQSENVENPVEKPEEAENASRKTARDVSALVPPCMVRPLEGDNVCIDNAGGVHKTPYGALEQTYRNVTGRGERDFAALMSKVHGMCPGGCRASPERVGECYNLVASALERSDPSKGSPWALVRHVITHDRGGADA